MFQFLSMFFPSVMVVALRWVWNVKPRKTLSYVLEYGIWVLLINVVMTVILYFGYGITEMDLDSVPFNALLTLQYIGLSLGMGIAAAFFISSFSLHFRPLVPRKIELKTRPAKIVTYVVAPLLILAGVLIAFSTQWVLWNFGLVTPEKLIFQMKVPVEGADSSFLTRYILESVCTSVLLVLAVMLLVFLPWKRELCIQLQLPRLARKWIIAPVAGIRRYTAAFSVFMLLFGLVYFSVGLNLPGFITYVFDNSTFVEENFTDTATTKLTFPEAKRNLIYIFMESMENTYKSVDEGGAQPRNLIPELTDIAKQNTSFSTDAMGGAQQVHGTGWTIAAMVAQTSGLPLKMPISSNSYGTYSQLLPGATSLGDILEAQGYNQMLMVGSDANFGGRKDYFQQHGNYTVKDYYTAVTDGIIKKGYKVWWGFEDKYLYEYAKDEIQDLAAGDKPFNFTMLTVDTHHVSGYRCSLCDNEFDTNYANVIACASRQVYEFLSWIQQQDFYENTTVVIVGDHLSMDPNFFKNLDSNYLRTTYNAFINPAAETEFTQNRRFATFDMFPTVLASLGVDIEGNRLGLGTNLFSGKPTLMEQYGYDELDSELSKSSKFYNSKFLYPDK